MKDLVNWHVRYQSPHPGWCAPQPTYVWIPCWHVDTSFFSFFLSTTTKLVLSWNCTFLTGSLKLSHISTGCFCFSHCWLIYSINSTYYYCLHMRKILIWENLPLWAIGNISQALGEQDWPWGGIRHLFLLPKLILRCVHLFVWSSGWFCCINFFGNPCSGSMRGLIKVWSFYLQHSKMEVVAVKT